MTLTYRIRTVVGIDPGVNYLCAMVSDPCTYCGKIFEVQSAYYKRTRRFCSLSCAHSHNNSIRVWKDESRKKISDKAKLRDVRGDKNPNYRDAWTNFVCEECTCEFRVMDTDVRNKKRSGKFCSLECYRIARSKYKMCPEKARIYKIMGRNISSSLKRRGLKKGKCKWTEMVGYSLNELAEHLERNFKEGMSWSNYGRNGWHIDHIKPSSFFSYTSFKCSEFKQCWALENLQPMWEKDNIRKGGTNNPKMRAKYGAAN